MRTRQMIIATVTELNGELVGDGSMDWAKKAIESVRTRRVEVKRVLCLAPANYHKRFNAGLPTK